MKRVLTAVILIPLVVLALFLAPLWLFTLLVLGVALLAAKEYFDIAEATGFRPFRGWGCVFLVCIFALTYVKAFRLEARSSITYGPVVAIVAQAMLLVLLASPLILMANSLRREPLSQSLPDAAISFLLIPYIGAALLALVLMRESEFGAFFLLYLMLIVWAGDIAALYMGRAIGKHKLAPRISPGKTWEGTVASVVGAVMVGVLLFHYINPIASGFRSAHLLKPPTVEFGSPNSDSSFEFSLAPLWFVAVFAACVNVAAQVGDLVESALKRGAGLKDSGTLLPGHGGVLDRIDALLFALPVGLVFYMGGLSGYFDVHGIR